MTKITDEQWAMLERLAEADRAADTVRQTWLPVGGAVAERAVRVLEDAGLCRTVPADQVLRAHPSRPAGARAARITPEGRDALAYRLGRADPDRLIDLIDHNEVTPAVNQIETHPFFQRTADQSASDIRLHTMRVRDSFSCARTPQVRGGS